MSEPTISNEREVLSLSPALDSHGDIFYGAIQYACGLQWNDKDINAIETCVMDALNDIGTGDKFVKTAHGQLRIHFKPHTEDPNRLRGKEVAGFLPLMPLPPSMPENGENEHDDEAERKSKHYTILLKNGDYINCEAASFMLDGEYYRFFDTFGRQDGFIPTGQVDALLPSAEVPVQPHCGLSYLWPIRIK